MKFIIISLGLTITALHAFSQKQVTILCNIDNRGHIYYNDLGKILPAAMKDSLLISPGKEFKIRHVEDGLMWMGLHGWKVVGLMNSAIDLYLLSKEIILDESDYALFEKNLNGLTRATSLVPETR